MSAADKLLPRLNRVKRTAPGKWIACCPAHDDKSPSLAIRETEDGRVLVHCFGGCSVESVLGAIGLDMAALFPERDRTPGAGPKPERRPWLPADVFDLARREVGIVAVIACDMHSVRTVSDGDHARLLRAASTLDRIAEASYDR